MEENKILQDVGEAIISKPITLTIDIIYPTLRERLLRKKQATFELKPLVLGKMIQISNVLLTIEVAEKDNLHGMNLISTLAANHGEKLAEIVAICISPSRRFDKSFVSFLINNLSIEELEKAAVVVVSQMKITSFLNSIIMLKGTNILKSVVSPAEPKETIAFGEQSEV